MGALTAESHNFLNVLQSFQDYFGTFNKFNEQLSPVYMYVCMYVCMYIELQVYVCMQFMYAVCIYACMYSCDV